MTACNLRPPEGNPFHGTGVACHLRAGHAEPHSWDVDASIERLELMTGEVRAGRADMLIGTCGDCGHWFAVDEIGEPCPSDTTEGRVHPVNYYVLCGTRR